MFFVVIVVAVLIRECECVCGKVVVEKREQKKEVCTCLRSLLLIKEGEREKENKMAWPSSSIVVVNECV